MTGEPERDMNWTSDLPDWHWYVILHTEERGEMVLGAMEPHRAAAKKYVESQLDIDVTEWDRTYTPRPSWDCPVCGVHEGATKEPNLRGDHDWACMSCGSKMWGEPMDWDRIEKGPWVPKHRQEPRKPRDTTEQQQLGGYNGE